MTTEELRAHALKMFDALLDRKQLQQLRPNELWADCDPNTALNLIRSDGHQNHIRIKPEPRKVWVGWYAAGSVMVDNEEAKARFKWHSPVKWQLVEEVK